MLVCRQSGQPEFEELTIPVQLLILSPPAKLGTIEVKDRVSCRQGRDPNFSTGVMLKIFFRGREVETNNCINIK